MNAIFKFAGIYKITTIYLGKLQQKQILVGEVHNHNLFSNISRFFR